MLFLLLTVALLWPSSAKLNGAAQESEPDYKNNNCVSCHSRLLEPLRVGKRSLDRSNSFATTAGQDRYFATHNEIAILTHEIGIFPQSLGNIPRRKSLSASFESLPATLPMLAQMLQRAAT